VQFSRLQLDRLTRLACFGIALQFAARAQTAASITTPEALSRPSRGELFVTGEKISEATGIKLVLISPGTFLMGGPDDNYDRQPVTKVTLTRYYWLGVTDVTQAQYEEVTGENPSTFKGPNKPVETVGWDEAMEFCEELTKREHAAGRLPEGYAYTLPTEAQWEYACLAGTTGARYGKLDDIAWYSGNSYDTTHPVGQKRPNAWGLYDMIGNVWQWCFDWHANLPGGRVSDPSGPPMGDNHICRGGSYGNTAAYCSSDYRDGDDPDVLGHSWVGFRVALAPIR
jgi:formylglycine-generating enzyme required for sulfatase activity